jgi:hypothetical protein
MLGLATSAGDTTTNTRGRILTARMEDRQLLLWQTPAITGKGQVGEMSVVILYCPLSRRRALRTLVRNTSGYAHN